MKSDWAIQAALADLPKDLSETFARILRKSGSLDPLLQAKTLQLILAAYRPLTTDELREALSVTPGDATWDPSRVLNNVNSALACCGCLVAIDEEEFTVRVIHHSVKQYMLSGLDNAKHMGFSPEDAKRTMADTVVTYLGYGIFGTELSRAKVNLSIAESVPSKIIQATMGSSSTARNIAMKLLKSRRQPTFDMSKAIADARRSFTSKAEGPFRFYTYARTYWPAHILYVSGHENAMFKLSDKLIHGRALELEEADESYWTHIQWAVKNGNVNVLGLLFEAGKIDAHVQDSEGDTPLIKAVRNRDGDMVKALLDVGKVDVEAKDAFGITILHWAAYSGAGDVAEILLRSNKADVEAKDGLGRTPLISAAEEGSEDVVKALLSVGKANVGAKDDKRNTALHWAARQGHRNVVEILLRLGKADIEADDEEGNTALHWAARHGHRDVVKILLNLGKADVEAYNAYEATPLHWAARQGYRDVVAVLLSLAKAYVEAKDSEGATALMWAASYGKEDVVEVLLSLGKANANKKDDHGDTARDRALEAGHKDIADLLAKHCSTI
jgi:ankyrin repeat protein